MRVRLKPVGRQTIVITGGTSGNGLATTREAVRRGAAVVLAARNAEALERVRRELSEKGGRVAVCAAASRAKPTSRGSPKSRSSGSAASTAG